MSRLPLSQMRFFCQKYVSDYLDISLDKVKRSLELLNGVPPAATLRFQRLASETRYRDYYTAILGRATGKLPSRQKVQTINATPTISPLQGPSLQAFQYPAACSPNASPTNTTTAPSITANPYDAPPSRLRITYPVLNMALPDRGPDSAPGAQTCLWPFAGSVQG